MIPYLMITGYSDSGKTLVTSRLIALLTGKGYRTAAVKHAHKGYDFDTPGKDSWQFFENGAREVVVASPRSFFIHRRVETEPDLDELLSAIREVDIILVEGFKQHAGPKIRVYREGHSSDKLPVTGEVLAVVSDPKTEEKVPCFGFDELDQLAELIINSLLKTP
jgi:molybdopterin-guanine dinucleotide biosynthesis protein B